MLRINEIKLPLDYREQDLKKATARVLKIKPESIKTLSVARKSIDARKKSDIKFIFAVDVEIDGNEDNILKQCGSNRVSSSQIYDYVLPPVARKSKYRPVVVGFGPAGMFCALTLAKAGLKPLVIERGCDVDKRKKDVENFWDNRVLNENSNVQFGEGGAGTFSDGKLTTGIKNKRCREVFLQFEKHGAPSEILYSAKPHIGTDKLTDVVKNIRNTIIALGGDVVFESKLTNIIIANGVVHGITYEHNNKASDLETDCVVLAIGHSARDTVKMLYAKGIKMMQKPFSVGARIEHPREIIDKAQYGGFAGHTALGAADYKLSCHPLHGRGAYTFCMCPGGTVVAAASEKGGVVVNGMSEYARDCENSNSALLVGIEPENFPSGHPLSGIDYQLQMEQTAFKIGGGDYHAPAQLVGDFLNCKATKSFKSVNPSCPTGVVPSDIRLVLPQKVTDTMASAIIEMDKKLKGFSMYDAVLTAPETRSSSPVRIIRDDFLECNIGNIYPCGEGAGYAGGIVSAAVDGIRCAEAIIVDEHNY
ncbi:MAG: hypothetical protein WBK75_05230 [Acutalibacteraceae bacterium]